MLESYKINNLLIGELVTVSNQGWSRGPMLSCEGPYIFYKISEEKYVEVFTETEYDYHRPSNATTRQSYKVSENIEFNEFGKTYINETVSILNYLTNEELTSFKENSDLSLSKKRIVEIFRNMTIQKAEDEKQEDALVNQYTKKLGK